MRRDHRPYRLKRTLLNIERLYARRFLVPHFESIGPGYFIVRPWHVQVFGPSVVAGDFVNILAASDLKVRLSVWPSAPGRGGIRIGHYGLISPGVRISSSCGIRIGDNCMIAHGAYITDSDWHDVYNRVEAGKSAPVEIGDNVWIGDGATVCKGVTIGENSIVGAGAVVVSAIPANCIAGGNPARVVKTLDPRKGFVTRAQWFGQGEEMFRQMDRFDRELLKSNTWRHWLRYAFSPTRRD
jgi:acetyltransferase-like isoleucine patch superfamily enzyme